jgi:hypothetical protein
LSEPRLPRGRNVLRLRKLTTTLSLIAVATVGVSLAAQTARANCITPLQIIDYESGITYQGFLSCGSSAGNYIANTSLGTTGDEDIADLLCDLGACSSNSVFLDNKAKGVLLEICSAAPAAAPRPGIPLKTRSRS